MAKKMCLPEPAASASVDVALTNLHLLDQRVRRFRTVVKDDAIGVALPGIVRQLPLGGVGAFPVGDFMQLDDVPTRAQQSNSARRVGRGGLLGHMVCIRVAKAPDHPGFRAHTVIPEGNFDHVAGCQLDLLVVCRQPRCS